jgi:hypothetical protein
VNLLRERVLLGKQMASRWAGCFRLRICMNMFVSSCYGCLSIIQRVVWGRDAKLNSGIAGFVIWTRET